jgi:cytochrome c oxidase subunit III
MTKPRPMIDVRELPDYAFGHQGLIWWGTTAFMVIEGSSFALLFVTYFFYRVKAPHWPPDGSYPALRLGTINLILMLVSAIPNQFSKTAAEQFHVQRARLWLLVCLALGVAFMVVRWFEFSALGTSWDSNAYGSIVWVTLGTHALQVVTQLGETAVIAALMFTAHTEPKRLVDVSENARYWYFVVVTYVPIYLLIYWGPRWL